MRFPSMSSGTSANTCLAAFWRTVLPGHTATTAGMTFWWPFSCKGRGVYLLRYPPHGRARGAPRGSRLSPSPCPTMGALLAEASACIFSIMRRVWSIRSWGFFCRKWKRHCSAAVRMSRTTRALGPSPLSIASARRSMPIVLPLLCHRRGVQHGRRGCTVSPAFLTDAAITQVQQQTRRRVLKLFQRRAVLSEDATERMLGWDHQRRFLPER